MFHDFEHCSAPFFVFFLIPRTIKVDTSRRTLAEYSLIYGITRSVFLALVLPSLCADHSCSHISEPGKAC